MYLIEYDFTPLHPHKLMGGKQKINILGLWAPFTMGI